MRIFLALYFYSLTSTSFLIADEFNFLHENVLGTSLEISIVTDGAQSAEEVESLTLLEIDRLASVFSSHDSASELSQWQRGTKDERVSQDLAEVLKQAEIWRSRSDGAFDVRASTTAQSSAITLREAPYGVADDNLVSRYDRQPITLDAIAKGYILDSVCIMVKERFGNVSDFSINIGGDVRRFGTALFRIGITDPLKPSENAIPLTVIETQGDTAVATSGGYRRGDIVDGRRHSHIIDPRTADCVVDVLSATVIAPKAIDADAAATAISVLGHEEGLALIESMPQYECLLVLSNHHIATSSGWPALQDDNEIDEEDDKTKSGLIVNFTLNRPNGSRYRRPYVAIWLEDSDGFPVKTALLWLQVEQPGPRWHRDLTRWYRNDRMRKVVEKTNMIGTISGATRGPGEYQARFDGTDNEGNKLENGKYTLCLEVAREHGTYQIIREPIALDGNPIAKKSLKSNIELSSVNIEYVPIADDQ